MGKKTMEKQGQDGKFLKSQTGNIKDPDLPYRPCVGIMLLNEQGMVFVARRIDTPQAWQMPQGGIDRKETPRDAAFRELKEEIGTNDADILGQTEDWLSYDLPPELIGKAFKGRFRGQRQKWFAMRFNGRDDDIDLSGGKHAEFDAWKWVPMPMLPELIVPFKRPVYLQVLKYFGHLAEG